MSGSYEVYGIGPKGSIQRKSYQFMTNDKVEAERLRDEGGPDWEIKTIVVKERKQWRKK